MNVKKPKHYMEQCRLTLFNRSLIILSLTNLQNKRSQKCTGGRWSITTVGATSTRHVVTFLRCCSSGYVEAHDVGFPVTMLQCRLLAEI